MGDKKFRVVGATRDESNLTELNATTAVNNGFIDHADWLAHVMRYAVVMDEMKHGHQTSLLDVGCGNFPLLTFLWRNRVPMQTLHYTGIDMRATPGWLEGKLPDCNMIDLVQMNIVKDDPAQIGKHQIVVCTEMLEHIDKRDALELMKRLRSWITPDGLLFLSSPNLGGSPTVADNHVGPDGEPREWTYEGKLRLLAATGFRVVDSLGTFIRLDHIPDRFWTEDTQRIKERLPNSFFRVFAAAAFPAEANNAMIIARPE
jgi:2-polyprenyl-3-methyl-5-hydroxy-6-metoxy-1,4-benzoquinol methylase